MHESDDFCPDIVTYATLIDCYTKHSSGNSSDGKEIKEETDRQKRKVGRFRSRGR